MLELSHPVIFDAKVELGSRFQSLDNAQSINLVLHGVSLQVMTRSQRIQQDLLRFPQVESSTDDVDAEIWFHDVSSEGFGAEWHAETNSELWIRQDGDNELAVQRDFVGSADGRIFHVAVMAGVSDGLYNAFRWLLPRFMVGRFTLPLHSAAIVDRQGRAHLFCGPSGAGKTTMAQKALQEGYQTLGDDMNVMSVATGTVEAGAFGQNPHFQGPIGPQFPLQACYFLQQGDCLRMAKLSSPRACRYLLSSILFPGWQNSEPSLATELLHLGQEFVQRHPIYHLETTLSTLVEDILYA